VTVDPLLAVSSLVALLALATNAALWMRALRRIRSWRKSREAVVFLDQWPAAHVFVCIKGKLPDLAESVRALEEQDYRGSYRVTYIVEQDDPAHEAIERLVAKSARMDVKTVGPVTSSGFRCAQKNFNLLHGIEHAESLGRPLEIYAFCDGDLVVTRTWLREMVHPIAAGESEGSTSFHFVEAQGRSVLGALHGMAETWQSLAALLCRGAAWGGSMAIRRRVFHQVRLADVWRETVVDDMTMSKVIKAQRVRVAAVPQFLVTSKSVITSYRGFVRWLGRQFFFVKIYSPFWYVMMGAQMLLNCITLTFASFHLTSLVIEGSWPAGPAAGIATAVAAAGVVASFFFSRFLIPERPPFRAWVGAALLVNAASFLACADATLRRRKLTWSDFTYFLERDGRVSRIVGSRLADGTDSPDAEPERAIA
jgi:cellulose synthase/poly-beta-1,6-N-acetylglucosamine synthase-like glycosyltransferase